MKSLNEQRADYYESLDDRTLGAVVLDTIWDVGKTIIKHAGKTEKPMTVSKIAFPLGKRVLLMKEEAVAVSDGGIVIPDQAREKPLVAQVVRCGPDVMTVHDGDEVIYASFAGTEFQVDGVDIIVVDEDDIMLVLRTRAEAES